MNFLASFVTPHLKNLKYFIEKVVKLKIEPNPSKIFFLSVPASPTTNAVEIKPKNECLQFNLFFYSIFFNMHPPSNLYRK